MTKPNITHRTRIRSCADYINEISDDLIRQQMADEAKEDCMTDDCPDCGDPFCMGSCDEGLTENEKMAQAGMSDDEISLVNHIDNIQGELDKARNAISSLLKRIDNLCGAELHCLGHTPSWYVDAAAIACGVKLEDEDLGGLPIPNSDAKIACKWRDNVSIATPVGIIADTDDLPGGLVAEATAQADLEAEQMEQAIQIAELITSLVNELVTTPAGLKMTAKASFMAGLNDEIEDEKRR